MSLRHLAPRGRAAFLLLTLLLVPGCYRIATPGPARPTAPDESHTMTTLVWGLLEDDGLDAICQDRGGIAEVTATTPPLFVLATVATLGFWAPIHVETRCLTIGANDARQ